MHGGLSHIVTLFFLISIILVLHATFMKGCFVSFQDLTVKSPIMVQRIYVIQALAAL